MDSAKGESAMDHAILNSGIVIGLFLSAVLLSLPPRNRRVWALSLMMVLAGTLILVQEQAIFAGFDVAIAFSGILDFLLAPLVFLFVRALARPTESLSPPKLAGHVLPFLAALGFAGLMSGLDGIHWRQADGPGAGTVLLLWTAARFGIYAVYLSASFILIRSMGQNNRTAPRPATAGLVNWLWLLGIAAFLNMSATAAYTAGLISDPLIRLACTGLLSFSAFGLGYLLMVHPALRGAIRTFRTAIAPGDISAHARLRLRQVLVAEKAYLDPDLSLADVARATGLTRERASTALQAEFGEKFYDCLARLRHEEFLRLCLIPGNRTRPVLDLALEAGFNSKAVFYRTFARFEDRTPLQYRRDQTTAGLSAAE